MSPSANASTTVTVMASVDGLLSVIVTVEVVSVAPLGASERVVLLSAIVIAGCALAMAVAAGPLTLTAGSPLVFTAHTEKVYVAPLTRSDTACVNSPFTAGVVFVPDRVSWPSALACQS